MNSSHSFSSIRTYNATFANTATGFESIPLRPEAVPMEEYPYEALGVLKEPVEACAALTNAHFVTCAQSFLAAATLAVQGLANVELPNNQIIPINNFFLTVASSGDGKSACDNHALRPFKKYQEELVDEYRSKYSKWKRDYAIWEKSLSKSVKKSENGDTGDSTISKYIEPLEPLLPHLICEEPTPEGLARRFNKGQPSQGLIADEGGQFVGGHGMNDESRLRTITSLSKYWDGKDVSRVRASGEDYIVKNKRLSVHLMLQPIVANQLFNIQNLKGQGFLARFLMAAPPSMVGKRFFIIPDPALQDCLSAYNDKIEDIIRKPLPLLKGHRNELQPRTLVLTSTQLDEWITFQHDVERARSNGGAWESIPEFSAKISEHALRLAAVLTLIENPDALTLTNTSLKNGMRLARFYLKEAVRMENAGVFDIRIIHAEKLLQWIEKSDRKQFTLRDVCQYGPNQIRHKKQAEIAINKLLEHRYIIEDGKKYRVL